MRPLLLAALAATLLVTAGLALWPGDGATVLAPLPAAARPGAASAAGTKPAATGPATAALPPGLPTRAADWPAPSPAALAAWQAAPPVPPVLTASRQPPGPASQPPVFPYTWIGQLDDGGAPQLLLASAQRSVAVRLGATLDGRWRLQRSAGGQLLAQALPDGEAVPVPGAPLSATP
jgi:hypothetical protein